MRSKILIDNIATEDPRIRDFEPSLIMYLPTSHSEPLRRRYIFHPNPVSVYNLCACPIALDISEKQLNVSKRRKGIILCKSKF